MKDKDFVAMVRTLLSTRQCLSDAIVKDVTHETFLVLGNDRKLINNTKLRGLVQWLIS